MLNAETHLAGVQGDGVDVPGVALHYRLNLSPFLADAYHLWS